MIKAINNFINIQPPPKDGDFDTYLKNIENGHFKEKLCYGISDYDAGYLCLDPVIQPGALFCGGMGSGKSIGMKFTVITKMLSDSENSFFILFDGSKGMTDYKTLFPYKDNVVTALDDVSKLVSLIEMLSAEMHARKAEFTKMQANNIQTYDQMMRKKNPKHQDTARIFLCIEEFHAIPNHSSIQYLQNVDKEGTTANMLKEILRVGRSYGIFLLCATQRATSDDFPSSLRPGITQIMVFRVSNPNDATAAGLSHASEISSTTRGRCAYENGFLQFPWITDDTAEMLLKHYVKPFKGKLFKYQVADYHTAFQGDGNQGMVHIKPFKSLFENWQSYNSDALITRFLKYFNFEVEPQLNSALNIQLIGTKEDTKFAIHIIKKSNKIGSSTGFTNKTAQTVQEHAQVLGCSNIMVIQLDTQIGNMGGMNSSLTTISNNANNIVLDYEDLLKISSVIDNRYSLEEEHNFDKLFNNFVLVKFFDDRREKKRLESDNTKEEPELKQPLKLEEIEAFEKSFDAIFSEKKK